MLRSTEHVIQWKQDLSGPHGHVALPPLPLSLRATNNLKKTAIKSAHLLIRKTTWTANCTYRRAHQIGSWRPQLCGVEKVATANSSCSSSSVTDNSGASRLSWLLASGHFALRKGAVKKLKWRFGVEICRHSGRRLTTRCTWQLS
jgi:hypothetical protein